MPNQPQEKTVKLNLKPFICCRNSSLQVNVPFVFWTRLYQLKTCKSAKHLFSARGWYSVP